MKSALSLNTLKQGLITNLWRVQRYTGAKWSDHHLIEVTIVTESEVTIITRVAQSLRSRRQGWHCKRRQDLLRPCLIWTWHCAMVTLMQRFSSSEPITLLIIIIIIIVVVVVVLFIIIIIIIMSSSSISRRRFGMPLHAPLLLVAKKRWKRAVVAGGCRSQVPFDVSLHAVIPITWTRTLTSPRELKPSKGKSSSNAYINIILS